MATDFIGLSAAAKGRNRVYPYKCNTAGLKEAAVVVYDGSVDGGAVKAPTGAAVAGVAGVLVDVQNAATGTTEGSDQNVAIDGVQPVLLAAGETVVAGDALVVAGTAGTVRKLNTGTDDGADIVGYSTQAHTAGATSEWILARIEITRFKA